jgi:hypothetical protein
MQAVAPEVAEQAVLYNRFLMVAWAVIMVLVVMLAGVMLRYYRKQWGAADHYENCDGYAAGAYISGVVGGGACFIFTILVVNLVSTYIAPDYYAADCMVELGRKALGG